MEPPFLVSFLGRLLAFQFTTSFRNSLWWSITTFWLSRIVISMVKWVWIRILVPVCSPQDANLYIIFIQLHPLEIWLLSRCWPFPKYSIRLSMVQNLGNMTRGMVCTIPIYGTAMSGLRPRGMLFMGLLGDFIGHRRALLLTKALVVLGAFLWRPENKLPFWDFNRAGCLIGYLPT